VEEEEIYVSKYRLEIRIIMAALLISILIIVAEYFIVNKGNIPQLSVQPHLTGQQNETGGQETAQPEETAETQLQANETEPQTNKTE
jgi:hypothetical protein